MTPKEQMDIKVLVGEWKASLRPVCRGIVTSGFVQMVHIPLVMLWVRNALPREGSQPGNNVNINILSSTHPEMIQSTAQAPREAVHRRSYKGFESFSRPAVLASAFLINRFQSLYPSWTILREVFKTSYKESMVEKNGFNHDAVSLKMSSRDS